MELGKALLSVPTHHSSINVPLTKGKEARVNSSYVESTISTPEPLAAAPEPLYLTADYPDPADSPVADPDLVSNLSTVYSPDPASSPDPTYSTPVKTGIEYLSTNKEYEWNLSYRASGRELL